MAGLFFGNRKGYDFYGIELKNANVRLRFANRTYWLVFTAEFTVGEGELMTHDEPFFMAPDDKHDLISETCSHLP